MTITPIEDVGFDDAATLVMGEAFDRTCKSLRIIGDTVQCVRSSQSELLTPSRMVSVIPPASMSRH
jgi:hypothetical protein